MTHEIDLVDIFAGPGGLGEGFSSFRDKAGHYPFQLLVSAEMDAAAHSTLSLRSFYRACRREGGVTLRRYLELLHRSTDAREGTVAALAAAGPLASLWRRAGVEVQRIVLGTESGNHVLHRRIRANARRSRRPLVLIGGPPCQAYSVVGRVRNRGNRNYRPEDDNRHFLYREYLKILTEFEPDIFVMENVMGLLSSRVGGQWIVEKILRDLRNPSGKVRKRLRGAVEEYVLIPLTPSVSGPHMAGTEADPMEFVVRAEQHGIPQTRHRVIILGVHRSVARRLTNIPRLTPVLAGPVPAGNVLIDLPRVRSGLSERTDSTAAWCKAVERERKRLVQLLRRSQPEVAEELSRMRVSPRLGRSARTYRGNPATRNPLAQHYRGEELDLLFNHDTRTHMDADLGRYLFCAVFAELFDRSPGSADFPAELAPNHKSWAAGHFRDRFRVQTANRPGSTVTSHLAKDGHHFIHWDASQCRSLTVREAARIQSFPDDYIFLGNRTQQYTQVGNAVPPLLARQIAAVVADIFS